jgi:hypothetical protein
VVQGLVSALRGKCPNVTFLMGSRTVIATSSTIYTAGACASLVFAQRVEVTGVAKGTTLTASAIKERKNKDGL